MESLEELGSELITRHFSFVTLQLRSQQRALSAVTALSELHKMFRKRPSPASVFLDLIISHVNLPNQQEYNSIGDLKARNLPKHKIPQVSITKMLSIFFFFFIKAQNSLLFLYIHVE